MIFFPVIVSFLLGVELAELFFVSGVAGVFWAQALKVIKGIKISDNKIFFIALV
jgi:hypothetical protein